MISSEPPPVDEAFLASKKAMWGNFVWLCGGGAVATAVVLVALALIFLT